MTEQAVTGRTKAKAMSGVTGTPVEQLSAVPKRSWSSRYGGYLFLLPYLLLFTGFLLIPLFYGFGLSLIGYEMLSPAPPEFIGAANYREAMGDPYFWQALRATGWFVLMAVPLTVGLALAVAAMIDIVPEHRQGFYRVLIFLPTMITISVAGILWRWFFNVEFGLFNEFLGKVGIWIPWLTEATWAMRSIVLMTIWWTLGVPMVILLAGLKQIPVAYYEAASLDGATGFRRFYHITLPLLRPVLLFVVVMNVIGAFQVFGQTFMITSGGPEVATRVMVHYIYETAFNFYRLGYGSAMSWILFIIIAAFSILQFRLLREKR